jgi:hypothetical protein
MVQRVMERSSTTLDLYTRRTDDPTRILRALDDEEDGAAAVLIPIRSWAFGSGTARPPPQGSSFSCTGGSLIGVGEELRRATYGIPAGRASATTRHSTTYNGRRGGPPFPHATATPRGHRKCFAYLVPGRTPTLTEPTSAPLDAVVRQLDALD